MIATRFRGACWIAAALAVAAGIALLARSPEPPAATSLEEDLRQLRERVAKNPELVEATASPPYAPFGDDARRSLHEVENVNFERAWVKGIEAEIAVLERNIRAETERVLELLKHAANRREISAASKRMQEIQRQLIELEHKLENLREKNDLLILPEPRDPTQS